jgi:hypothetical protein
MDEADGRQADIKELRPLGHPSLSGSCGFSLCYNQLKRPGTIVSYNDVS